MFFMLLSLVKMDLQKKKVKGKHLHVFVKNHCTVCIETCQVLSGGQSPPDSLVKFLRHGLIFLFKWGHETSIILVCH